MNFDPGCNPTPRIPRIELYPVVRDLTETEYACSSGFKGLCCRQMLGSFAFEELALPNVRALQASNSPETSREQHNRDRSTCQSKGATDLGSGLHSTLMPPTECFKPIPRDSSRSATWLLGTQYQHMLETPPFENAFVLTRQVYHQNISTVWECVHRDSGHRYCVKMTDKRRFIRRSDSAAVIQEISVLTSLQTLRSRHLPRLVHVSEDEHQYYMVMDYVQGGNLSTLLQIQHNLCEDRVRAIGRSLLLVVAELHRLSLGHFNLSPENIILSTSGDNEVVVCDFGCALDLRHSRGLAINASSTRWDPVSPHRYGVLHYAAPELLGTEKGYGLAADLWSVGVILYELFCGHLPFEGASRRVLKDKILLGKFEFAGTEWYSVSRLAKQLISALLDPDPQVRLTVGEALEHPWFVTKRRVEEIQVTLPSKKSKLRNKFRRMFGRTREIDSHHLHRPHKVSLSPPIPTSLKHSDLSTASTLTDSQSNGTGSSAVRVRWDSTLPRPLAYYRRPRLVGV